MSRFYQTKYNPDYCDLLIEHMAQGHSIESFSGRIGVSPTTVYGWKNTHEEFSEACEVGFRASLFYWEKVLKNSANGQSKGNAAAIIFKLKNTFREWYKDRQEIEMTQAAVIQVNTGIDKTLPDVEGEIVRKKLSGSDHANNLLKSNTYVDLDTIEEAVFSEDSLPESQGEDLL